MTKVERPRERPCFATFFFCALRFAAARSRDFSGADVCAALASAMPPMAEPPAGH